MSWASAVSTKLNTMKQYCINQSNSVCAEANKANSVAAYTAQFNALSSAISTYLTANKAGRETQLKDLITFDFVNTQTENVNYVPAIVRPESPFPTGHDDYWSLFKMNGFVDTLLGYADSYFFEACIITPSGTTARLQSAISTVNGAESADSLTRAALIAFLQAPTLFNGLIFLTEQIEVTGTFRSKQQTGEVIYETKHAAEIINDFSLDVYIPTYI